MKLALGPISYHWEREHIFAFYRAMVATSIDIIYLGETVCGKRRSLDLKDWLDLARSLRDQGKEVVLSTLALIESESELGVVQRSCLQHEFLVEANDMAAVQFRSEQALPFVAGPSVNIYNGQTLDFLAARHLQRWVLPVELGKDVLRDIRAQSTQSCEVEVFAWGHLPLAYSARCFTARAENLPKDDCQFVCMRHPDGLPLYSQDNKLLFNINGIQTQSGDKTDLVEEITAFRELGVDVLRLSPVSDPARMESVIEKFRRALAGEPCLAEPGSCNGYWHGRAGMEVTA